MHVRDAPVPAIRRRDLVGAGLSTAELSRGLAEGSWERLARGLYAPTERGATSWSTLHEVQRYAPNVVFCLETALALHELSDVQPHAVWLALARGMRRPKITWVQVEFMTVDRALWDVGVESFATESGPLRVTSVARTIVDCFRMRRRVGLETALHALRDARARQRVSPNELLRLARRFRQERTMLPYVEAVG